jgi:NO-binding membrane sensor protein with MHYT domain
MLNASFLIGTYSPSLVVISLCVAMLASYTALDMVGRIATAHGRSIGWWTAGGAFAMGIGVWSMHFIGMLAFELPIALGYDLWLTVLSLLIAMGALWTPGRWGARHGQRHRRDALHRHGGAAADAWYQL